MIIQHARKPRTKTETCVKEISKLSRKFQKNMSLSVLSNMAKTMQIVGSRNILF